METSQFEERKRELLDLITKKVPIDLLLDSIAAIVMDCKAIHPIEASPLFTFIQTCKFTFNY